MDFPPAKIEELIDEAEMDGSFARHPLLFVLWVIAHELSVIAYKGLDVNTYRMGE